MARNWDALKLLMQEWARDQSVMDLYRAGQARRVPLAPVSTMGDLLASDHLKARGFFAVVAHPLAGQLTCPGAPYQFSDTPWTIRRSAPLLGEHNEDIFMRELGVSAARLQALRQAGVV